MPRHLARLIRWAEVGQVLALVLVVGLGVWLVAVLVQQTSLLRRINQDQEARAAADAALQAQRITDQAAVLARIDATDDLLLRALRGTRITCRGKRTLACRLHVPVIRLPVPVPSAPTSGSPTAPPPRPAPGLPRPPPPPP